MTFSWFHFAVNSHLYNILLIIIWNTLLPTSLFQSYLAAGFSFVWIIATVLTAASAEKALDEDRISATKEKSCTNVLYLPTLLTSAFQFDTVFLLWLHVCCHYFCFSSDETFFWCWSCFLLSATQRLLCIQLSAVTTQSLHSCGREKKRFGFAFGVLVPNLDWREI